MKTIAILMPLKRRGTYVTAYSLAELVMAEARRARMQTRWRRRDVARAEKWKRLNKMARAA